MAESRWWKGSEFLYNLEPEGPQDQSTMEHDKTAISERVKNPPEMTHVPTATEEPSTEINLSQIINCQSFSSLDHLLRVTAYVLRFVTKVKRCLSKETNATGGEVIDFERNNELNSKELKQTELLWIRTVLSNSFPKEISYLEKSRQATPRRIQQFQLFLDEDKVLRCREGLKNASLQVETKNPILMPKTIPWSNC